VVTQAKIREDIDGGITEHWVQIPGKPPCRWTSK